MKTSISIIAFIALALVACNSTKKMEQKKGTTATEQQTTPKTDFDHSVTEKYWKLVELNGQPVSMGENQAKEAHFILKEADKRITGNSGCNQFSGTYELADGNRIQFSQLVSTKMACLDMSLEQRFLKVLSTVDNYSLNGDSLTLNRARMAPLARFVAVYF
ncbi:MAG: META domain-containing protein [Mangrovibacterium sp.]